MSNPTIPLTFLLILTYSALLSQSIIPSRYDGFVYRKRAASTATVLIEAFYDPVCPDSRDSWPPLKQAVDHYGPTVVSLIVHTFPLPLVLLLLLLLFRLFYVLSVS
ncbi:putative Thioredoxin-like superfamily [Helianthus annuus]|nr:putative Thioredoxin-like superfamily [Helianthus annuus]